ncbi:MAG: hypothetical protein MJ252_04150 [archaeon]|nr:hypothetical protein [archaeon]
MADKKGGKDGKEEIDYTALDKDWRGVIENELKFQENWQKDWGFLADNSIRENPRTREEQIQVLEEKLKTMSDIKIESVNKSSYTGGSYDILIKDYNKRKTSELMPQTRRPQKLSKAYAFLHGGEGGK